VSAGDYSRYPSAQIFLMCAFRDRPSNVQDEPRPWLARLVLLGARDVTAMVVGSGALLGVFRFINVLPRVR
jgi:hypothetical protein